MRVTARMHERQLDNKEAKMKTTLDTRELATVLAALRYWQREGFMSNGHEHSIASNDGDVKPLSMSEIDRLCERFEDAHEAAEDEGEDKQETA
jgi:hypothetical protein